VTSRQCNVSSIWTPFYLLMMGRYRALGFSRLLWFVQSWSRHRRRRDDCYRLPVERSVDEQLRRWRNVRCWLLLLLLFKLIGDQIHRGTQTNRRYRCPNSTLLQSSKTALWWVGSQRKFRHGENLDCGPLLVGMCDGVVALLLLLHKHDVVIFVSGRN
jgi:hypothetical protein